MPVPRDYRTVDNPKLLSRDVLVWICENSPDSITSNQVSKEFGISLQEACTRLSILRKYGCLKIYSKKARPMVYYVTKWGLKCAERWKK